MSTYAYTSCPVCSKGTWNGAKPVVSLLVQVSTVRSSHGNRKQKTSGSLAMCSDCLASILDGKPLPQKLISGLTEACKQIGVQVQRALPLAVSKKQKAAKA